jgi:tetratricopeptide (TPR) repeat protein
MLEFATNFSNISESIQPHYDILILIFTILGSLAGLEYFTKIPKYIWNKSITPTDCRALVEYDRYFTEDELEKFNLKYVDRIEEKGKRDVIDEVRQFLKSSNQVLIITGESGTGKTRLAVEVSKEINSGWEFWNKCLFVNLRHYKEPVDIKDRLNKELSKHITVIFDDYQYNLDVFNEVKNIAFKRDSKIIITTRPIFVGGLKEKIGQAAIKPLFLGRMDVKDILSDIHDEHLKERIIRISEGIPSIALLALDYVEDFTTQGGQSFFQGITSKGEFFSKIIHDFEKETSRDFVKFLAGGALIGGITKIPKEYEEHIKLFVNSGHIIRTGNMCRLTPDILSDYLIYNIFFDVVIPKSYFTELATYNNNEHILEVLNSVIRLNDSSEIYREAVQILFESVDVKQKKKRIKLGISAYEGFGSIRLVTDNLGEFWKDYKELDEASDLLSLGIFLVKISKFNEAKICWENAEKLFNKINDRSGIASTLNNIAIIHRLKGEYDEALEKYNQSLKIKTELDDGNDIAATLNNIAIIHQVKGEYDKALEKYNQSLKIKTELGDRNGIAATLNNIAGILNDKGEYDEALEKYNQSLKIKTELGDRSGIAATLNNIAIVHNDKGEYDEALEKYNQSLKIKTELGNRSGIAATLNNIAIIHQVKGEYDKALEKYNQSLKIQTELGDRSGTAMTKAQLGVFYRDRGDVSKSLIHFISANKIFCEIGDKPNYTKTLGDIAATIDLIDKQKITDKSPQLPALQEARNLFAKEKDEANTEKVDALIAEIQVRGKEKPSDE